MLLVSDTSLRILGALLIVGRRAGLVMLGVLRLDHLI